MISVNSVKPSNGGAISLATSEREQSGCKGKDAVARPPS